ncbi:MAG: redoxin domain-containing protein, partial [Buchnera aphidicola]|nr:redoxin domain-containing protein [Buchnera aphidicola]
APAILKNGDIIDEFNLKDFAKSKTTVLFFWPMDFTFVCPSEIMEFDKLYIDFKKRNVKIVGVSIDSIFVHQAWRNTLPKNGGIGQIQFPIVSDIKREIQN